MFAFDRVTQDIDKGFHVRKLFDISKKFQQEKADGIIGKSGDTVPVGNDGPDKRKIDRGRYKSGQPADNTPIGFDFNIPSLVGVFG